jgi:hypothetical protein
MGTISCYGCIYLDRNILLLLKKLQCGGWPEKHLVLSLCRYSQSSESVCGNYFGGWHNRRWVSAFPWIAQPGFITWSIIQVDKDFVPFLDAVEHGDEAAAPYHVDSNLWKRRTVVDNAHNSWQAAVAVRKAAPTTSILSLGMRAVQNRLLACSGTKPLRCVSVLIWQAVSRRWSPFIPWLKIPKRSRRSTSSAQRAEKRWGI